MDRTFTPPIVALAALATGMLNAQPSRSAGFTDASLSGAYAVTSAGDGSVSVGVGVAHFDGKGGTRRRILVNAPDSQGGRRTLVFEATGTYSVNADGTGAAVYENTISTGQTSTVSVDFVITGAASTWIPGRGQARVAIEMFSVQREAGATVSLVTASHTRIADE